MHIYVYLQKYITYLHTYISYIYTFTFVYIHMDMYNICIYKYMYMYYISIERENRPPRKLQNAAGKRGNRKKLDASQCAFPLLWPQ